MLNTLIQRSLLLALILGIGLSSALAVPRMRDFKPDVKYAQVGDIRLAYYTRGEGEPLVMINGFLSTMSLWDPALIEKLAGQHRLILFDNRGVGLSTDTDQNNTSIPQMADDVSGLVRSLGLNQVSILGYSMGARIAQQVMIRHPELVQKAILCAADPGGSQQAFPAEDVEARLNNPNIPEMDKVALTFPDTAQGREAAQAVVARIKAAVAAGTMPNDFSISRQTIARQDRARTVLWNRDESNFANLKTIKVPVLITDGRSDIIDPPRNALLIAEQIPFSWLAFFDGGHAFLFQSFQKFADTVNVFLQ